MKENAIDKILNNGRAIIKPAKTGFFKDNQLANAMIKLEINNLEMKMSIFKKMDVHFLSIYEISSIFQKIPEITCKQLKKLLF